MRDFVDDFGLGRGSKFQFRFYQFVLRIFLGWCVFMRNPLLEVAGLTLFDSPHSNFVDKGLHLHGLL